MLSSLKVAAFAAAFSALSSAAPALADSLALDFTGTADGVHTHIDRTLGWAFDVTSSVTVTALGLWDADTDGLAESHDVAIWDSGGTIVVTLTVGPSGNDVPTGGAGQWVFNALASSVVLGVGSYTIGAYYTDDGDHLTAEQSSVTTATGISYVGDRIIEATGLTRPTETDASFEKGFFGPNFLVAGGSVGSVPEPASWALMILAFAGLGIARRPRFAR